MPSKSTFNQSGAIVRLRLRNFMTYNDVSLKPGPKLNMVIGPNGTGKSAIVCSIIVGLAGEVSLTGRANNIASLVQKGCDWGSSEIELYNSEGRNHVIERKITITSRAEGKIDHKSEWKLNGKSVQMRIVKKLIEDLNIKVDNLCQFLPQDSVASFVKMSPGELLKNTLTAAGDSKLVDDLDNLVKLTDDISTTKLTLDDLTKQSAENEVNARRLETEVQEIQAREELVKKKDICSLKVYYSRYNEALTNCDKAKDILKDKEQNLRQQKSYGAPVQAKIDHYKAEDVRYRGMTRDKIGESKKCEELLDRSWRNLEERKMSCQEAFSRFRKMKDQNEHREQQIGLKQQELESLKNRQDEIKDVDYTNDIALLKVQAKEVQVLLLSKTEEKSKIQREIRYLIGQLEEKKTKRLDLLAVREKRLNWVFGRRPDYRRVVEWLAMHRDTFRKEVLLPMFCDLNIKNPAFADVIEYIMNEQDLYSFVCQTDEDLERFSDHAHSHLRARINVILQPDKSVSDFEREMADRGPDSFRGVKFIGYLKDMVEAPEPIMRFLCGSHNFHRIPIFEDLSEAQLDRMMQTYPKFFSRKTFYNISTSRYDQARTVFNEKISDSKLLKNNLSDKKALESLESQIESLEQERVALDEKIKEIDQECHQLQAKFSNLNKQCSELLSKQNERERLERQISSCQKTLDDLKADIVDIEMERAKLKETIEQIDRDSIDDLKKLEQLFDTYVRIRECQLLYAMLSALARKNFRLAESTYDDTMKKAKELERLIQEDKEELRILESRCDRFKREAHENIPGMRNGKLDTATKKKFASIEQETVDDLERYEEELKARIEGMQGVVSDQLLREFNRQTRELANRKKQIQELEAAVKTMTAEQATIKESFLSQLGDVIRVIDEHYQDFMRKLNYDGKIELAFDPNDADDFSKYGINIMVKYRDNEQLIPLSSTRQSGGERSVATMIYMLALQTKTSVPFRVVDEINQGMDKDNERKVFELLVRTADESSSQYFLVSPKLLSGLAYGDQMSIHIVFNGPQLNFSFKNLKSAYDDDDGDDENDQLSSQPRARRVNLQDVEVDVETVDTEEVDVKPRLRRLRRV